VRKLDIRKDIEDQKHLKPIDCLDLDNLENKRLINFDVYFKSSKTPKSPKESDGEDDISPRDIRRFLSQYFVLRQSGMFLKKAVIGKYKVKYTTTE